MSEIEHDDRMLAAFKCLELAMIECKHANPQVKFIHAALDYGRSIKLTEEELREVLNMKVKDLFQLEEEC
jgi:hypothetical protein